jgi:hypothetical protein
MKSKHVIRLLILTGCVFALFLACDTGTNGEPTPSSEPPPIYLSGEGLAAATLTVGGSNGAARYFSLVDGREVDPYYANSGEYWDIALESVYPFFLIYTNSGASGTGSGGVTYTNKTVFEDVDLGDAVDISGDSEYGVYAQDVTRYISTMADPTPCRLNVMTYYGFNSGTGLSEDPFEGSGMMIGKWDKKASYSQNSGVMPPSFSPTNTVYIVTHADGVTKSKVQLTAISVAYGGSATYTVSFQFEEAPPALESIEITTEPNIKVYPAGDDLILAGLVVKGTYSDGTENLNETITETNITGYDKNNPGPQTLTVTVRDKTDTFDVTVGGEGLYWRRSNNSAAEKADITSFSMASSMTWLGTGSNTGVNTTYTIILESNQSLAATSIPDIKNGSKLILRGLDTERTIQLTGTGALFAMGNVTLQLDENITLKGVSSNDNPLISIALNGNLVMNAGSKITGNTNTGGYGGGLAVWTGNFTMNGGEISGNNAGGSSPFGGGVYFGEGSFTMNDGIINDNSAVDGNGGGVYLSDYGTFSMKGGTISKNDAAYGGGVSVVESGWSDGKMIFEKSGGTIYGNGDSGNTNNATSEGIAVYLGSGKKMDTTAGPTVKLYAKENGDDTWSYDGGGTIGDTSDTWEEE